MKRNRVDASIAIDSQSLSFDPPQLRQHPEPLVCARDFRVDGDDVLLVPLSVLVVLVNIVIIDLHGIQRGGGSRTGGHVVVAFVIGASCSLEAYGAPLG